MLTEASQRAFLHVVIYHASGMPSNLSGAYVRIRLKEGKWMQTPPAASADWNQGFFFPVNTNDSLLMLEMLDQIDFHTDPIIGALDIRFREHEPNVRHVVKQRLSAKGSETDVQLELEFRFAEDAWKLA